MYERNYLYINNEEQRRIANTHLTIVGAGLGSNIAECAIRLGFLNLTLIDGDIVELSNLNRQYYYRQDIGCQKTESLRNNLLRINPQANITSYNVFLNETNMVELLANSDVVINTIDFISEMPFVLDAYCKQKGVLSIHPYNLGWAGCIFITGKESEMPVFECENIQEYEIKIVQQLLGYHEKKGHNFQYLYALIDDYKQNYSSQPPPQLAVASRLIAGAVCDIVARIACGKKVKQYPESYIIKL